MNTRIRTLIRHLSMRPTPALSQEQVNAFLDNPCWRALRQAAAGRIDQALDIERRATSMETILQTRGVVQGLSFILQGEDILMEMITDNAEVLLSAADQDDKLRQVLQLLEEESHELEPPA